MTVQLISRTIVVIALLILTSSNWPREACAQGADELVYLRTQVSQLYSQGKYAEAAPVAERYLALVRRKHGENHPEYATAISWLAYFYQAQGRYADAEPLYKRALAIRERALGPENPSVASTLNNLAAMYFKQGRYAESEPLNRRALAVDEKVLGAEHPDVAFDLNNLADLYRTQGRYAQAEPLSKRALAIREKALGPEHPDVARSLNNLAAIYHNLGRYAEPEPLYKRALAIDEKALGAEHPDIGSDLNNLAALYYEQGRYAEAEPLMKRALAINEKALGAAHPDVASDLNNLAELYRAQGRYAEAEPLLKRALAIGEKALGTWHPDVATSLSKLSVLYLAQGRYAEAEPLLKRALAIREKAFGPEHPDVASTLDELAELYLDQGHYAEPEPLLKRALAIRERALGSQHQDVAAALNSLAVLYHALRRYAEAEPLLRRALAIDEKALGPEHPKLASFLNNLAEHFHAQGRDAEAEPLLRRALAINEKALGAEHPHVAQSLNNLAALYRAQGRYAEAEPLHRRALAVDGKMLGSDHPDVATDLNQLAWLALARREWGQAAAYWRSAAEVIQRRTDRGLAGTAGGSVRGEAARSDWYFSGLIKMTDRLAPQGHAERARLGREMFEMAQWVQASEAATSLTQMAARSAKGNAALARLVRERQDLVSEWQVKDKQLIAVKSEPPAKRNSDAEKYLSDRLTAIDARLAAIDARLVKDFPEYASLTSLKPLSVPEVQGLLRDGEALVFFLDTGRNWEPILSEETFVWVITKGDTRWVKSELGTKALAERVNALRCGLDATLWDDPEGARRCKDLVGVPHNESVTIGGKPQSIAVLPFDLSRAYELYRGLLGAVADTIKDKRLIIVPSGPLTSLPFNVLITKPYEPSIPNTLAQYRYVAWLGVRTAITVLPSVASLKALRQFAKSSSGSKPYLGIGNPLLNGAQDDPVWGADDKKRAELARTKRCMQTQHLQEIASRGPRPVRGFAAMFRGTHADIEQIRYQAPLPETADELCEVAWRLGVPNDEILLGVNATEARLKDLSEQGRLADYAIVHFATHGALSGQVEGLAEPGLVLTPPPKGTSDPQALERDDGFLSASEIAALKLDADWVILSACNTAGPQGEGAEALSGMARAFFYAGARALLVSHWEVGSDAAVKLTTRAFAELKAHPEIGRAEAMRISMRELIEKDTPAEAHPSIWAPFVVVGEGAAFK